MSAFFHELLIPHRNFSPKALELNQKPFQRLSMWTDRISCDPAPLRSARVFPVYAAQIENSIRALAATLPSISELALGGTAVFGNRPKFSVSSFGKKTPKGFLSSLGKLLLSQLRN
jgi:fumarate hydratase class II